LQGKDDADAWAYISSCSTCRKKGEYLHCDCKDQKGDTKEASVEMRAGCTKYGNDNGLLVCQVRILD
jgi:hypothetical protein